jgi:type IV pilus assembly protein PilW
MDKRISLRKSDLGFSLVELLVATAITLISLLIIVQVFSVYDGWKRTTTGTAQSQENGLLAAFSIERDLRSAGFGMVGLGCSTINAYNAGLVAPPISATGLPVTITQDSPVAGTDRISILYSSSPFGNIAARLQVDMPDSDRLLRVNNGVGFNQGDMIILFEPPKDCSILQLSQDAQATGVPNVTGPGHLMGFAACPRRSEWHRLSMEYATQPGEHSVCCTRLYPRRRRPGSQSRPVG